MILVNIDLLYDEAEKKPHEVHMSKAIDIFKTSFQTVFDLADLGDTTMPLSFQVLSRDPNHPIVRTILYLYSLEPPFYRILNRACREKDYKMVDKVGPFAAVLGDIVRYQDP